MDEKLQYVDPEKYFWFVTGDCAKSLGEIAEKLKILDADSFKYHVNKEKNDISNWIKSVIKDDVLSKKLNWNLSKIEFIKLIDNRLRMLKKDPELELPSLSDHLKRRRVNQIKELLDDINYKLIHHSDILDKYEKVRELYKKLDRDYKQEVYGNVVKTYNKMQELWSKINF